VEDIEDLKNCRTYEKKNPEEEAEVFEKEIPPP
jgi:hypothetical protein